VETATFVKTLFPISGWEFLLSGGGREAVARSLLQRFRGRPAFVTGEKYELFAAFLSEAPPLCYNSDDFNEV
jgi:hypothetical protein